MTKVFKSSFFVFCLLAVCLMGKSAFAGQTDLGNRLKGYIVLSVEERGEAYYVDPLTQKAYYMKDPAKALEIMRTFGLGITNANLNKIPIAGSSDKGDWSLRKRLSGRILLQVESRGQAWYVYPGDLKRYYLGSQYDAFNLMRAKGLGISKINLSKLAVANQDNPISYSNSVETMKGLINKALESKYINYTLVGDYEQLEANKFEAYGGLRLTFFCPPPQTSFPQAYLITGYGADVPYEWMPIKAIDNFWQSDGYLNMVANQQDFVIVCKKNDGRLFKKTISITEQQAAKAPDSFTLNKKIKLPNISSYQNVLAGDRDNDNKNDLFLVDGNTFYEIQNGFDKVFYSYIESYINNPRLDLLADINNDNKDEVFISGNNGVDEIFTIAYDGNNKRIQTYTLNVEQYGGSIDSSLWAKMVLDIDGDGKKELIAQANAGYGWKPRGLYCFDLVSGVLKWNYNIGPSITEIKTVDLNYDGKLDFLLGTYSPSNGNYEESNNTDDMTAYIIAISSEGRLLWLKDLGTYFTGSFWISTDFEFGKIVVAATAGNDFRDEMGVISELSYIGDSLRQYDVESRIVSQKVADINNDGKNELIITDRLGDLTVLDGNFNVLEKKIVISTVSGNIDNIEFKIEAINDFNADGKKEILATYAEREFVSGRNPRSDGGEANVRYYHNNQVLLLDSNFNILTSGYIADTYEQFPGLQAIYWPNSSGNGDYIILADQIYDLNLK